LTGKEHGIYNRIHDQRRYRKYHLANPGLDWTHNEENDVFLMLNANVRGEESQLNRCLLYRKSEIHCYSVWQYFDKEYKMLVWKMQIFGDKPQYKSEEERQK
jgi:hypothetical protein